MNFLVEVIIVNFSECIVDVTNDDFRTYNQKCVFYLFIIFSQQILPEI